MRKRRKTKLCVTYQDRERMRKSLKYALTMLNLQLKTMWLLVTSDDRGAEKAEDETNDLRSHPEKLFFTSDELKNGI